MKGLFSAAMVVVSPPGLVSEFWDQGSIMNVNKYYTDIHGLQRIAPILWVVCDSAFHRGCHWCLLNERSVCCLYVFFMDVFLQYLLTYK